MTVSSTTSRWTYTGDNLTTVFAYDNKIFADGDLSVTSDGVEQTLTTDYTISGAGDEDGGSVTYVTAPASGVAVVIVRDLDDNQETDIPAAGAFPAESVEDALDYRTIISQQQQEILDRCMQTDIDDTEWNAESKKITNGADGSGLQDFATLANVANAVAAASIIDNSATIRNFLTIAFMEADTDIALGDSIAVQDYATGNKSGILFFKAVAAATGTADGGSFIDLTNTTPALQAQQNFPAKKTVKMWGAVFSPVGAQVDTITAIQAANDYIGSNGGGALHFPFIGSSNYYHIGTGIANIYGNMTYTGDSPSANQVRAMDGSNIDMYTCTPGGAGLDNISMANMHFNGNKSNNSTGKGIVCSNIHAISHFEHTMVSQCKEAEFELTGCTVVQLLNTYAIASDSYGYDIDSCSSLMMTDIVSEFHGNSYMRIRNASDTSTIIASIKGGHFEGASSDPSSGFGIEVSGGATNPLFLGITDLEFRATSMTANPIRINDARCNVIINSMTTVAWGAAISNADTARNVSGKGTINYIYTPVLGISQLDNIDVIGKIRNVQSSGDAMALRRADFAAVELGTDDDNTWILQDNTSALKGFDRRSATSTQRFGFDSSAVATHTSLLLYDVDSGIVERVKVGANGSGSIANHRMLQVPDV